MTRPSLSDLPFVGWLDTQRRRDGWIGKLAQVVALDVKIPRTAGPDAVRTRMREVQAEYEMLRALDDAERDWQNY